MSNVGESILKEVADIKSVMQDTFKSMDERLAEARRMADKALADMAEYRKTHVNPNAPVTSTQGEAAAQTGGLFKGKFKLGYKKMLSLPPSNPVLNSGDAEQLKALQDLHDALVIRWHVERRNAPAHVGPEYVIEKMRKSLDWQAYENAMISAGYIKAANDILNPAGGTGGGPNLDFTLLSAQLIEQVRLASNVATQFRTVALTRAKQEFPALRADVKAVLGGGVALPATDSSTVGGFPTANALVRPTFGQVAFSAKHFLGFMPYNDDMIEDSVVPMLPILREQAGLMIARGKDDCTLNGDTQSTHIDEDVTAAYDIRKAFNGLRRLGMNNEASIGAAISSADIWTLMGKMGKFATNPRDLVLFLHVTDWLKLMGTQDLRYNYYYGPGNTLQTGVTDRVANVDIVVSEFVRRDVEGVNGSGWDVGEYDSSGNHDHALEIMCNRTRFWFGQKAEVDVEEVRVPQALGGWLQADVRVDFQAIDKEDTDAIFASGDAPVAIGVDVTQ